MWAAIRDFPFHDEDDVTLIPGGAKITILSPESDDFNDEADSVRFNPRIP